LTTDKKNQHYIPKFYLRNFSFEHNQKQIGLYHVGRDFFYSKAKLKTQGSKTFYYGQDGTLENSLSKVEGIISRSIRRIISTIELPPAKSKDHLNLLYFTALTHLRNPVAINQLKDSIEQMRTALLEEDSRTDIDKLIPSLTHEQAIQMALSPIGQIVDIMSDLDYKLILNRTDNPFISSDFPVVKYNRFLEKLKWQHGKTGYGTVGLQIFIPLNPNIMIVFFDRRIYKVGNKKDKFIELTDTLDIDKLNELQVINCFTTLFFNEIVTNDYMDCLIRKSSKYECANVATTKMSYLVMPGEDINDLKHKNLIVSGSTDCETELEISGIKMHSGSRKVEKEVKKSTSVAQLRPKAREILEKVH
jgi:hypothetical protein